VVKQNCFLIFKEALTNIVKHSNADKVVINMRCQEKGLFMSIADNGRGDSSGNSNGGGNGLKNMQRRANKMLSELTISRHNGFCIELIVPKAFAG
jgi:signal transduction histidine kinase